MNKNRTHVILGAALVLALVLSCGKKKAADKETDGPLQVVASTPIIGDILSQFTGDHITLDILMPPGQNPHAWAPTPRDLVVLEDADLLFINGAGLETQLLPILDSLTGPAVVELTQGINLIMADHGHDDHEADDGR